MSDKPAADLGDIASTVTPSTADLAKVVTAGSEAAGVAFELGSVEKFKVHKDNPTQVPLGTKK
jgi:intracellular multiplication protein IcmD